MKCDDETLKATDNENEDCLDKLIDENNIDSCSSDCNESSTKKRYKTHRKPKVSTEKQSANEQIDVDPNAPKKKRKYKKRAVKEKQMFECETCHYKCYHECTSPVCESLNVQLNNDDNYSDSRSLTTSQIDPPK